MRCSVHLVVALSLLLACNSSPLWAADPATEPYIDRVETQHDTVFLTGGRGTELGRIVDVDGDENITLEGANGGKRVIQKKDIDRIEYHRSAEQVIRKRGEQALARNDFNDVMQTLKWAREKGEFAAGIELAETTLAQAPAQVDIGKFAIQLLKEQGDNVKLEAMARKLVAMDQHWTEGFEVVAALLEADPARESDLKHWLNDWNRLQPTAYQPNKYLAGIYERSGELKLAQEAYRKCWTLHKDQASGLGYARISLRRGDVSKALESAETLLNEPTLADEAKAIVGSAKLAQGQLDEAETLLRESLQGTLSADSKQYATYNLGFIYLHNNKGQEARELWKTLTTPVAELALACLEHRPFEQVELLPSEGLKKLAKELNAAVGLENAQFQMAGALDPTGSKRNLFLTQVAKVLQSVGSPQSIRELSATNTVESLRWQAYGHMLAGRYKECEQVIKQLPEDDGYGLAYQLLIFDSRKDQNSALDVYKRLAASPNAPKDWLVKVAAIFESANDEYKDEQFDWPEGVVAQSGWKYSAPGTGIKIHSGRGKLNFDGIQAVSPNRVSRAFFLVPQERLRMVKVTLDISAISTALGGIELLDERQEKGVQLGVTSDSKLAWRQVRNFTTYGDWQPLDLQVQGTSVTLGIDYMNGRAMAFVPEAPQNKYPMGEDQFGQSSMLTVGIWCAAEPGTDFKFAADSMQVQQKPVGGDPESNNRFGTK